MSNSTDFIDDDLSGGGIRRDGTIDPLAARRAAANNLERMSEQRERLEDQVASTAQELERLKQRREDLESRKHSLQEIRKQQEGYINEKKDMAQKVHQSLVMLEKEEVRVAQLTDLYADTRRKFGTMRDTIDSMDEGAWDEDRFHEELGKALDQLKALRMDFNKTLARLDAFGWPPADGEDEDVREHTGLAASDARGFADWMLVGLAIGLPVALLLGLAAVGVYFALTQWIPI